MSAGETWRPVFGYEGLYEVSDQGSVRSIDRVIARADGHTAKLRGRVLAQRLNHLYMRVTLCEAGKQSSWCVHRLVADAFHGPKVSTTTVVRHLNGDALDNRAENLTWGTHAENSADMLTHGTNHWANQTHCINGHQFTEANTRVMVNPHRRECRACDRVRCEKKRAAKRALRKSTLNVSCSVCGQAFSGDPRSRWCSVECHKASRRVAYIRSEVGA